jgi:uncharacterized protein YggE
MRNAKAVAAATAVALIATLALAGCGSTTTVSGGGPAPDTVTAIGTGTGSAAPDTAQISLGATFSARNRTAAQDGASKIAAAIIAAVKGAGIDEKDIQTGQVSLNPRYNSSGSTVTGYDAFQSIDIETKSLDKVSAAISAATAAGATNVSGPQFSLSDTNAARVDAIGKAMADAKTRAEAIAKASGRTLGRVISVTEAPVSQVSPIYDTARASSTKSVPVPIEPGQVDATTQLTVIFALQ